VNQSRSRELRRGQRQRRRTRSANGDRETSPGFSRISVGDYTLRLRCETRGSAREECAFDREGAASWLLQAWSSQAGSSMTMVEGTCSSSRTGILAQPSADALSAVSRARPWTPELPGGSSGLTRASTPMLLARSRSLAVAARAVQTHLLWSGRESFWETFPMASAVGTGEGSDAVSTRRECVDERLTANAITLFV